MDKILNEMKTYAHQNKVPIILDDTVNLLDVLLRLVKPKNILEIGTAIGYSAIIMAQTLCDGGRIDTIEINPDMVDKAWVNIEDAGLKKVIRVLEGDAVEILPNLNGEYDVIFVDAAKSKYIEFLPQCIRLVKENGLIISDNVLYKGMTKGSECVRHKQRTAVTQLREYLKSLEEHTQLKTTLIPIGDGLTISIKI